MSTPATTDFSALTGEVTCAGRRGYTPSPGVTRGAAVVLPARSAEPYCAEDAFTCWTRNGHLILDLAYSAEDDSEWEFDTSFTLASFTALRTELAAGDLRPLYLAWLSALTCWESQEGVDEDEYASAMEPPVPAGLAQPAPWHAEPNSGPGRTSWTAWPRTPSRPGRTSST